MIRYTQIVALVLLIIVCPLILATVAITPGNGAFPSGGILLIDSGTCPADFSEDVAFRGRYAVGTPSAGTLAGTQGTALTNLEARAAGAHTHTERVSDNVSGGASVYAGVFNPGTPQSGLIETASSGVSSTPAPYIQVIYCKKN